jgi:hypothetical protein
MDLHLKMEAVPLKCIVVTVYLMTVKVQRNKYSI